jgi:hypothetical protein
MSFKGKDSQEFLNTRKLLKTRRACDPRCYEAEEETHKNEKGKKVTLKILCRKMVSVDNIIKKCELYLNPCQQWSKGQCIFPGAALSIKDTDKPNLRKNRGIY